MSEATPRLLDLFCGAGGAAMGYARAGFDVTGVDIEPQSHYPFAFLLADALDYVATHGHDFDVIHASPPCQAYTGMRRITIARFGAVRTEHPDLIAATREILQSNGRPYVIENVQNSPLRTQFILCGAAMGLAGLARHRHFESNILFPAPPPCAHRKQPQSIGVYGKCPDGRRTSYRHHRLGRVCHSLEEGQRIMGIDWMDWHELKEAIPPAYTEWIGKHLLTMLQTRVEVRT